MGSIFITVCSKGTENECFEERLFGSAGEDFNVLRTIEKGTKGLLYNYETDELIGIFEATAALQLNNSSNHFRRIAPVLFNMRIVRNDEKVLTNASVDFFEPMGIDLPFRKQYQANADFLRTAVYPITVLEQFKKLQREWAPERQIKEKCFLMICKDSTEDQALKGLFATTKGRGHLIKKVRKGHRGLLYNYQSKQLIGIFEATHDGQPRTFNPDAFKPYDYPVQFTVKLVEELQKVQRLSNALRIFEKSGVGVRPIGTYARQTSSDNQQIFGQESIVPKAALYGPELMSGFRIGYESSIETRRVGTRAAIAAIMGRNMSHNIGSHVLSYLSDQSEKLNTGFYRYIQGRMDFIAEISTTRPTWTVKMRFLEDVLKPFIYSDIINKSSELLNNIGRSAYLETESGRLCLDANKIAILVSINNHQIRYRHRQNRGVFEKWPENSTDVDVEIPHGIIGCHALYSILENFIRNGIKHNPEKIANILSFDKERYELNISLREDMGMFTLQLFDNVSDGDNVFTINKIEAYLSGDKKGLIDDSGALKRDGGWGIKEMQISAAWLRNIPPENVQFETQNPPLLNIISTAADRLCFELRLLKSADVLIIDKRIFPDEGIDFIRTEKELRDLYYGGGLRYKFIISNDADISDFIRKKRSIFPERIFIVSDDNKDDGFVRITEKEYRDMLRKPQGIVGFLYKKWLYSLLDGKPLPRICVLGDSLNPENIKLLPSGPDKIIFEHGAEKISQDCLYWEPFSTSSGVNTLSGKIKILKDNNIKGNIKENILYELIETAIMSIVIIDERIYSCLDNDSRLFPTSITVKLHKLLAMWNVEVINLRRDEGSTIIVNRKNEQGEESILSWNEYVKDNTITFLSIHQTIIDAIGKEFFDCIKTSKNIRRTIIHSGRGNVDIMTGHKFVEFSNIKAFVVDQPDKHRLTELFTSITSGGEW